MHNLISVINFDMLSLMVYIWKINPFHIYNFIEIYWKLKLEKEYAYP